MFFPFQGFTLDAEFEERSSPEELGWNVQESAQTRKAARKPEERSARAERTDVAFTVKFADLIPRRITRVVARESI
jgi:hypothetical protein